ncbi:MAG: hypothetical protein F2534_15055 [Actinobacteria bacterium]|jgi:hypothetical protein|nr:hypothetical protein [Actinomycetota bacterium]
MTARSHTRTRRKLARRRRLKEIRLHQDLATGRRRPPTKRKRRVRVDLRRGRS